MEQHETVLQSQVNSHCEDQIIIFFSSCFLSVIYLQVMVLITFVGMIKSYMDMVKTKKMVTALNVCVIKASALTANESKR